jgi:acyl-CoA thioesterase-1
MHGESLFFIRESADQRPAAALLYPARKVLKVVYTPTGALLEEGRDFVISEGGTKLLLPEGSRIPFRTREDLFPAPGSPNSYPKKRDDDRHMLFGEGHFFHDMQVEATYTHEAGLWEARGGYVPRPAKKELPGARTKIARGGALKLALLGDSISEGYNASGAMGVAPYQPSYGWLVAEELRNGHDCAVEFLNFAVPGKATPWGVEVAHEVAKTKPDLAVIAFGMNDASDRLERDAYIANTKATIEAIRAGNPGVEFILVATMTANPEWSASSFEHYDQYREGLLGLAGPGVAVADLTSVWKELLKHKPFLSFTGNGVNHPNDFGHRLYAQVILKLLV